MNVYLDYRLPTRLHGRPRFPPPLPPFLRSPPKHPEAPLRRVRRRQVRSDQDKLGHAWKVVRSEIRRWFTCGHGGPYSPLALTRIVLMTGSPVRSRKSRQEELDQT